MMRTIKQVLKDSLKRKWNELKGELQYEQILRNSKGKIFLYVLYVMLIVYALAMGNTIREIQYTLNLVERQSDWNEPELEVSVGRFRTKKNDVGFVDSDAWIKMADESTSPNERRIRELAKECRLAVVINEKGYAIGINRGAVIKVSEWSSDVVDKAIVQKWIMYLMIIMSLAILLVYFGAAMLYFLSAWIITVLCLLLAGHLEYHIQIKQAYRLAVYGMTVPALLYGVVNAFQLTQYRGVKAALLVCTVFIACEYVMRRAKMLDDAVRSKKLQEQEREMQQLYEKQQARTVQEEKLESPMDPQSGRDMMLRVRKRWGVLYVAILAVWMLSFQLPLGHYVKGYGCYIIGDYYTANTHFSWCNDFLNSESMQQKSYYMRGVAALEGKEFGNKHKLGWKKGYERLVEITGDEETVKEKAYKAAEKRFQRADYVVAYEIYKYLAEELTSPYKDSVAQKKKAAYYAGVYYYNHGSLFAAYEAFLDADDYIIGLAREEWVRQFIEKYSKKYNQ